MPAMRVAYEQAVDRASSASRAWLRVLVVLCAVVPLLVFVVVAAVRLDAAEHEAKERIRRTVRIAHEQALKVLDTNESLLQRVLQLVGTEEDGAIRRDEAAIHRQLVALAQGKPQVQSIWVQGPDGRPLASNRFPQVPPELDVSDREFFRYHRDHRGGLYLTERLVGRVTRDPFFDLSIGRYRSDGSFAGLVSVGLYPSYFAEFYRDLTQSEPALALTLLRSDGAVYVRSPEGPRPLERLPDTSKILQEMRKGVQGAEVVGTSDFDGSMRFIVLRKVGPYPAYVTGALDLAAVREAWLREMAVFAAICAVPALGLVLAALLASRRTRQALRAANQLQAQTEARRQAEEALLQAQKLEAIGRLTGGVAHDFNNALMVLSGNLFLLRKAAGDQHRRMLDSMARAVDSASKLTRQLLAFSRKQVLAPRPLRLQEALPALEQLLRPVFGSRASFAIEVAPETPPVRVDEAELELAVLNLAMNARDAMPREGRFVLRARGAAPDSRFPDGSVLVEAVDNGEGIRPELVERVFEPFFTTKPAGQGTGLGLSQVRGFCERSGGLVSIHSAPGAGTTVRLQLPVHTGVDTPYDSTLPSPANVRARVLVVEDNEEVGAAVAETLEQVGCEVVWRTHAASALAWLEANPLPDVLLSDVAMPGEMDGIELARIVQQRHPSVRVVMMTGYAERQADLEGLGVPVLHKPFEPGALVAVLSTAAAGS